MILLPREKQTDASLNCFETEPPPPKLIKQCQVQNCGISLADVIMTAVAITIYHTLDFFSIKRATAVAIGL